MTEMVIIHTLELNAPSVMIFVFEDKNRREAHLCWIPIPGCANGRERAEFRVSAIDL